MATTGIPSAGAAAAMAVLLALTTAATGQDSACPTGLHLYQPECGQLLECGLANIKQTYTACECMDVPCSDGPYLFKFLRNETDPARAYLFTEPECKGDVTVIKSTIADCRDFKHRSVKICQPCSTPLLGAAQEE